MREVICTVSGHSAEITKTHQIRISHDRNSYLDPRDAAVLLPHPGFIGNGIFRTPEGVHPPISDVCGLRSGVQGETCQDGAETGSNGHLPLESNSGVVTFSPKVKAVVACGSAVLVAAVWMIPKLIGGAVALAHRLHISHLSGIPWIVGGVASYAIAGICIWPMLKIAKDSDQRIAEMGGK